MSHIDVAMPKSEVSAFFCINVCMCFLLLNDKQLVGFFQGAWFFNNTRTPLDDGVHSELSHKVSLCLRPVCLNIVGFMAKSFFFV